MYYLLTSKQFEQWRDLCSHNVAWSLDNSICVLHNDNSLDITEFEMVFENNHEVNEYRFNPNTEEWRNWITEEEYYGL